VSIVEEFGKHVEAWQLQELIVSELAGQTNTTATNDTNDTNLIGSTLVDKEDNGHRCGEHRL